MQLRQFRLRTLMIIIAFLALIVTVFVQTLRLRRAEISAELFRAVAEQSRAEAERSRQQARAAERQLLEQGRQ
jgi:NhaP-type Na+/H+ or K+/H+ antiporter